MRSILLSIDNPQVLVEEARFLNEKSKTLLHDPKFWKEWIMRHTNPRGSLDVSSEGFYNVLSYSGPYFVLRYNVQKSRWDISTFDTVDDICELAQHVPLSTTFNGGRVHFTFSERIDAWRRLSSEKKDRLAKFYLKKPASDVNLSQGADIVEKEVADTHDMWLPYYLGSHLCVVEDHATPINDPLTLLYSAFGRVMRETSDRPVVPV